MGGTYRLLSREAMRKNIRAFAAIGKTMQRCTEQITAAWSCWGRTLGIHAASLWWTVACLSYLEHHRRLPGSDRTSRLRRKRRAVVLRWYEKHLGEL